MLLVAIAIFGVLLAIGAFIVFYLRNGCLDGKPLHF